MKRTAADLEPAASPSTKITHASNDALKTIKLTSISDIPIKTGAISEHENNRLEQIYIQAQKKSSNLRKLFNPKKDGKSKDPAISWRAQDKVAAENQENKVKEPKDVDGLDGIESDKKIGDDVEQKNRLPKKRVALLLSYCGAGYQGMQM
jgi:tRNA pseudouridine38-40 synthase